MIQTGAGQPIIVAPPTEDRRRREELWSPTAERLLLRWSATWQRSADAHTAAARKKRFYGRACALPVTIIPLVIAPLTDGSVIDNVHVIVVVGLIVVACLNSIMTIMRYEATSEMHAQAAFRFEDLLSDAEEILSKRASARPDVDMCVSTFKTRSDYICRTAPDVTLADDDSDGESGDEVEGDDNDHATHVTLASISRVF
jgi:hypothetical protein